MKMKKYMVYMDDGQDVYKAAIPAVSEKAAREYVIGNGEVIAVKDVTKDYPISVEKVITALKKDGFGDTEINYISRYLEIGGIAEYTGF